MKQALKWWVGLCFCLSIIVPQGLRGEDITVVTEDWRPYNYAEGGKIVGVSAEIVEAVLQKARVSFTHQLFPWDRSYKMALEDKNVLIYTIARTPEREKLFKWVGSLAPRMVYLFKLKKRTDIRLTTLADAKRYKIGVVREDATTKFLLKKGFVENRQLEIVATEEINQRNLFAGKIDLITGNELSIAPQINGLGLAYADVEKTLLLVKGDYYMAFSRTTDDATVNRVKKALDDLRKEGLVKKVTTKYLSY